MTTIQGIFIAEHLIDLGGTGLTNGELCSDEEGISNILVDYY